MPTKEQTMARQKSPEWRKYYKEYSNLPKVRERKKRYYLKTKTECIQVYSNGTMKCACCGEDEFLFLTLDHINNDGAQHRLEVGKQSIYRHLKSNGFPDKDRLQVFCMNCNYGKQLNKGVCPHKTRCLDGRS